MFHYDSCLRPKGLRDIGHRTKYCIVYTYSILYSTQGWAMGIRSFQKNTMFLRSFVFFSKERNVLVFFSVLYKKNAAFFAFFYVLYKRTRCSLRSFTFFIKECSVLCVLLRSL